MYAPLSTLTHTHTKWLQKQKTFIINVSQTFCTYHQARGWIPHADKIVVPYCRRTVIIYSISFSASFQTVCINGPFSLIVICQNNLLRPNIVLICISATFSTNSLPVAKCIVPYWGLQLTPAAGSYDNPMPELTLSPQFRDYELGY